MEVTAKAAATPTFARNKKRFLLVNIARHRVTHNPYNQSGKGEAERITKQRPQTHKTTAPSTKKRQDPHRKIKAATTEIPMPTKKTFPFANWRANGFMAYEVLKKNKPV